VPRLIVTDRQGAVRGVDARYGLSVMENIRDNGFDELLALCGGCMSCATCHVHVDAQDFDRVGPPSPDETDLLEFSGHVVPTSRLSCQILFTAALDDLHITIAPED